MRDLPEDWRNEAVQRAIAIEGEALYGVPNPDFHRALTGTTWHTNDGDILDVSEMSPDHAHNALEWLIRERSVWASEKIIRESALGLALAARAKEDDDD